MPLPGIGNPHKISVLELHPWRWQWAWGTAGNAGGCCCSIPPAPPVSCSSTSQTTACPPLPSPGDHAIPKQYFLWGKDAEGSKYPSIPPLPCPSQTDLHMKAFFYPKDIGMNAPSSVVQNLCDSHPVSEGQSKNLPVCALWLFASYKITYVSAGILQEHQIYILTAVNLLKKFQKHSNTFSGMLTPSTL